MQTSSISSFVSQFSTAGTDFLISTCSIACEHRRISGCTIMIQDFQVFYLHVYLDLHINCLQWPSRMRGGVLRHAPVHIMHLSMSSSRGGGGGSGIGWGFWHFLKKIIKIPTSGQKRIVKMSRKNGLLPFYYIKLKDQMRDIRSKSPPWGYTPQSNSRGLPDPPPLGLDIDRCIITGKNDECSPLLSCHMIKFPGRVRCHITSAFHAFIIGRSEIHQGTGASFKF